MAQWLDAGQRSKRINNVIRDKVRPCTANGQVFVDEIALRQFVLGSLITLGKADLKLTEVKSIGIGHQVKLAQRARRNVGQANIAKRLSYVRSQGLLDALKPGGERRNIDQRAFTQEFA